jgi:hypothetical protein
MHMYFDSDPAAVRVLAKNLQKLKFKQTNVHGRGLVES